MHRSVATFLRFVLCEIVFFLAHFAPLLGLCGKGLLIVEKSGGGLLRLDADFTNDFVNVDQTVFALREAVPSGSGQNQFGVGGGGSGVQALSRPSLLVCIPNTSISATLSLLPSFHLLALFACLGLSVSLWELLVGFQFGLREAHLEFSLSLVGGGGQLFVILTDCVQRGVFNVLSVPVVAMETVARKVKGSTICAVSVVSGS